MRGNFVNFQNPKKLTEQCRNNINSTPPKPKKTPNPRKAKKQQKLEEFMKYQAFDCNISDEVLPDKDIVHREVKKYNLKRKQLGIPLINEEAH